MKLSWEGTAADPLRGYLNGLSFELAGIATAWMPLERIRLTSRRARFTPGLPAKLSVEAPELSITVGQRDLDRWLSGYGLPFRLQLAENGLVVHTEVAGLALSEFETTLDVVRGWFVLQPRRASVLGIPQGIARWFRTYLPLPPLSPEARLMGIDHAAGKLTLHIGVDGFEEDITSGLAGRLRRRILPRFA